MKKKELWKNADERGKLVSIEQLKDVSFEIKRVYYMYDMKTELKRGCHAHKETDQFLICLNGSCKVLLDDGIEREELILDNPNEGIYVNKHIWHEMYDFSDKTIILVLASEVYDESDYIRNYAEFQSYIKNTKLRKS